MMLACMIPFGVRGPVGAARDHGAARAGAREGYGCEAR